MKPVFINYQGKKLAVYESEGNGTDVLFVHGNSLSAETWKNQFQALGDSYHLVAFDFLGNGYSEYAGEKTSLYTIAGLIDQIRTVREYFKLKDHITIAHSLGGHLCYRLLKENPLLKGLVTFGSPPFRAPLNITEAFNPVPELQLPYKPEPTDEELEALVKVYTQEAYRKVIIEQIKKSDPVFREALGADLMTADHTDETEILASTKMPLLILQGEEEELVKLEYIQNLNLPTLYKKDVHLIENAKHCLQLDNPGKVNELIIEFMASIDKNDVSFNNPN